MNRYPAWKYIVIGVALVFGLLYTLPNLFHEVPAVQVSSSKAGAHSALSTTRRSGDPSPRVNPVPIPAPNRKSPSV